MYEIGNNVIVKCFLYDTGSFEFGILFFFSFFFFIKSRKMKMYGRDLWGLVQVPPKVYIEINKAKVSWSPANPNPGKNRDNFIIFGY